MKLGDFVSATINQVIDGVIAAQKYGKEKGARVVPQNLPVRDNTGRAVNVNYRPDQECIIEFDIGVTTTEGTQTEGGAGIFVGPVGIGGRGRASEDSQSVNRITFKIPVVLPAAE